VIARRQYATVMVDVSSRRRRRPRLAAAAAGRRGRGVTAAGRPGRPSVSRSHQRAMRSVWGRRVSAERRPGGRLQTARCWITRPLAANNKSARVHHARRRRPAPSATGAGAALGESLTAGTQLADGQLCHRGIYDAYLLARRCWPQQQQSV